MILEILLSFLLLAVVSLILFARWERGSLESLGYKVVKPHWLFGSFYSDIDSLVHWEDVKKAKEYGKVYGVYDGRIPTVVISDTSLIHRILFTDTDHFIKRQFTTNNPIFDENIEFLNGEKWKTIHSHLSPQLTSGKQKMYAEVIAKRSSEFISNLKQRCGSDGKIERVNLHDVFAPYVITVIGEAFCGINITDPYKPDNDFIKRMRAALFDGLEFGKGFEFVLMNTFPFIMSLLNRAFKNDLTFFTNQLDGILNQRESTPELAEKKDMVALLLEMRKKVKTDPEFKRVGITNDTVYAQGFEFFLGAYLGAVWTLKFMLHHLTLEENKEVLDKVMQEISQAGPEIGYEEALKMEYLSACMTETLRIAPGLLRIERVCNKDWTYDGMKIKKGMTVAFPLWAIQHDEENYPEPTKFRPERFLGEDGARIPKTAFLHFGAGMRQCMGQRFAYIMVKIMVARLLRDFKIERKEYTKWVEKKGNFFGLMHEPILVQFSKRDK